MIDGPMVTRFIKARFRKSQSCAISSGSSAVQSLRQRGSKLTAVKRKFVVALGQAQDPLVRDHLEIALTVLLPVNANMSIGGVSPPWLLPSPFYKAVSTIDIQPHECE